MSKLYTASDLLKVTSETLDRFAESSLIDDIMPALFESAFEGYDCAEIEIFDRYSVYTVRRLLELGFKVTSEVLIGADGTATVIPSSENHAIYLVSWTPEILSFKPV